MDVRFINPVLESIVNVLQTMAQLSPTPDRPSLKKDDEALGVVSGIIDMDGKETKGSVAISFSQPVALDITRRMLRRQPTEIDDMVKDLVGEITNMMAGGAKAKLEEKGFHFNLALPHVVAGKRHSINHGVDAPTILLPFHTDIGDFFVEICFPSQNPS